MVISRQNVSVLCTKRLPRACGPRNDMVFVVLALPHQRDKRSLISRNPLEPNQKLPCYDNAIKSKAANPLPVTKQYWISAQK